MTPPATLVSTTVPDRDAVLAVLRANRGRLAGTYGVRDLQLFGSVARGDATETSDVDLIVEFDPDRITLSTFLDFTDDLEALLGRRVDVVSLPKLTPRLRAQVEAEAIRVA
jgi:predicted nucleotidyltransferase